MRSAIVDFGRRRTDGRRSGNAGHTTFMLQLADGAAAGEDQILRVHEALDEPAKVDERMAKVVGMRYFGGLSGTEIAAALGTPECTVRRDWELARLFPSKASRQLASR